MLRSQQGSTPAQILLERVNDESPVCLQTYVAPSDQSLFWSSFNISDVKTLSTASAVDVDSTPKTLSQLFLENIDGHSCADLLQLGLSSFEPKLSKSSAIYSATTASSSGNNIFAPSKSGCESSPAMGAGSNYNFETPSLHQVSALAAPFSTSSPNIGIDGTADMDSGKTSPSHHEQNWNHQTPYDKRSGFESPGEAPSFQAPYPQSSTATGVHQTHYSHQDQLSEHDYQTHGSYRGASEYFQHRASISGPLMGSVANAERYESSAAAPAPPRVHGLAAWENASGSARPHTADGLFGQFGVVGAGAASHEGSADSSVLGNSAGSSSRPYTPGSQAAHIDPYYAHRRMSMPDSSSGLGASKVFSYMAGDDGAVVPSSGVGALSHSHGSHYIGGGFNASANKKRPRRRYDEIERLYPCSWPGCTKSYGTLNHLNAHVAMQKHGPKRSPSEFKDMRKAWRKQKKEEEQRRQSRQVSLTDPALRPGFGSSAYGDVPVSEPSGNASILPIGPPPALSGYSNQHTANMTGMGQLPGSMAHLSRYSMSSVSATPNADQPFYLSNASAETSSTMSQHHHDHGRDATPLQYTGESRPPYASNANNTQYSSLGAYLSAHRGSV
ncbi:related to putative C2H2 transcriptional regulator [Melanopsichium pennsylvanicum]|uniref:Related to putative C2H2 transcriptional regulator n=2 Tax=Melanopsichium pennsylvanicum TaxID=63383 RepID=A0AAJ5C580_9BASI|nr:related to putative C2H2 transcriptional regulator [Melanopsichium pennsylvanicum 4]SNX84450.1 related to putative C2H2 transcriptional regulator [Melanopsichium pennsylvanicum]